MARQLSNELIQQLTGEVSNDPFLMLVTISHDNFDTVYLVNNTVAVESRGNTYEPFPMNIRLPQDDGETQRNVDIIFDNVSLELIDELRVATTPVDCVLDMVLASDPDKVQISYEDLKIGNITYSKQNISAKLYLDDFLNTELTSEKYTPKNFPGLF